MSGITIILAEDEPKLRRLYSDYLSVHDYHVIATGNGLETLSLLDETLLQKLSTSALGKLGRSAAREGRGEDRLGPRLLRFHGVGHDLGEAGRLAGSGAR